MVVLHYLADRLQAGPLARMYMLGYEQMMRKKSIKSRKYRGPSPSKHQNILIFHQNPLQHPISSLSACHVIIYCESSKYLGEKRLIGSIARALDNRSLDISVVQNFSISGSSGWLEHDWSQTPMAG